MQYEAKTFDLGTLEGLSERQINAHLKLYEGYVKNFNKLNEQLERLRQDAEANAYAMAEVTRRKGFEFSGMRLHEYYFEQFESAEGEDSALKDALAEQFGSYDAWLEDFKRVGKTRGIGWAVLVRDNRTGYLINAWIDEHQLGHLAGQQILLAMDVWEHAYLLDYLPSERGDYIEAFFKNLNWQVVEQRYQ